MLMCHEGDSYWMRTHCGFSLPLGEFPMLCICSSVLACVVLPEWQHVVAFMCSASRFPSAKHAKWQHMVAISKAKWYN